jgi:hypothetical protein
MSWFVEIVRLRVHPAATGHFKAMREAALIFGRAQLSSFRELCVAMIRMETAHEPRTGSRVMAGFEALSRWPGLDRCGAAAVPISSS